LEVHSFEADAWLQSVWSRLEDHDSLSILPAMYWKSWKEDGKS